MTSTVTWSKVLQDKIPSDWAQEIDRFEAQMALRRQNKIEEKVFAESRLRRGVYGQRYDNGQRYDGRQTRRLAYPEADITKGPNTLWHAPGMQRIKVPFGGITPEQLEVIADLADEYSTGVMHVTTRQDFQLHFVHIEDTPDLMRRLAAVGITTQEACGNVVRNVTACYRAGVCPTEAFDVTPYARALAFFLLGHDDTQDFGRKMKIAFSGCEHEGCGLVRMHDIGYLARVQEVNGIKKRGFAVYVGGGLGTIPHQARLLSEFVPEEEILPLAQSIARVFARLGEKRNRNRARLKFLVADLGIEEFRRLVLAERESLPFDERWTAYLSDLDSETAPDLASEPALPQSPSPAYHAWLARNVEAQRQQGYHLVTVPLPLGDISSQQARRLAALARRYAHGRLRTTVEQNIVLRWVARSYLAELFAELDAIGLAEPAAGTIADITSCPGTDTCKLGIAASRGLARELRARLASEDAQLPDAVRNLRIKVSGCFNSCGHHHVADIGFFGNSRRRGQRTVPHFQVVLGGKWQDNAGGFGIAMGAIPSKRVPDVLFTLARRYAAERTEGETFQQWVARRGRSEIRRMLEPYMEIPPYEQDPSLYSDWRDPREFTLGDIGVGECAGEVVSLFSMEIARAEGEAFAAVLALDEHDYRQADERAYRAMLLAAKALVRTQNPDVGDDPDTIVCEFKTRFYETRLFFDPFARGKFADYLLARHAHPPATPGEDHARQIVDQANLFIEAAYACEARLAPQSPRSQSSQE
ncbi:MAG: nitrite/sulfite reductase [Caldilineae bacterium]|nr:MAG: nitrite/sulfite reductase [Caldilineae bacterium]